MNEALLSAYVNEFLGYGSLESPLWLIGPEAGGGRTSEERSKRLEVWNNRGRQELEDLQGYHAELGLPSRYDWSINIQKTWGSLIRVILAHKEGITANPEHVRTFQIEELGQTNGSNAVIDLSQLSTPSMKTWHADHCDIAWLADRKTYENCVLLRRCELIREKIAVNQHPKLVLFYGLSHQKYWERIAGAPFQPLKGSTDLSLVKSGTTIFAMMPHPNDRKRFRGKGARNQFFTNVGLVLRKELAQS